MRAVDQISDQSDGNGDFLAPNFAPSAVTAATAPNSGGQKRPALAQLPAPDASRQHLESPEDTFIENLNSAAAHRARLVALLTFISQHSAALEERLNARITSLENTQHTVQNTEIAVITVTPTVNTLSENTLAEKCNQNPNTNKNNVPAAEDDTTDALNSLREMQFSQLEIRYAAMETHFKTRVTVALREKEEAQRSAACLHSIASAAMQQAQECQDELDAVKAQMHSAHVSLLEEVASIVKHLQNEVDSLKEDHAALAAQVIVAAPPAAPEESSTSDD